MILIFDLDDTLYDTRTFVESGFTAVATYGARAYGWDAAAALRDMTNVLECEGSGRVFDIVLERHGRLSRGRIDTLVKVYRHHRPSLELFPAARRVLDHYQDKVRLYLVTDGHKVVQRNKVDALDLWPRFRWVMITHRFGLSRAKPSTYCFERIREVEGCDWRDMFYIGDNPTKDFVGLNRVGMPTVRVLTGPHREVQAKAGYEALYQIPNLDALPAVLSEEMGVRK